MSRRMLMIDGLQFSNWNREVFQQMCDGGLAAVHVTIAYWENSQDTLRNISHWNKLFASYADLIMPVRTAVDIETAYQSGRVGIIFGFQNCSPIEDDIGLVEIFHQLNVRIMQLTYNNQSLIGAGCYESHDAGISRFGNAVIGEMNRLGMVIDMSHSAEYSTLQAIELSSRPIVISHANPVSFEPARRNKSATVLKALAQTGGLLGFSLYPLHLKNGPACSLDEFCSMVADTVDLMGIHHVGIGSDLCCNQPVSMLNWMRNGRWSKQMDYGEGSVDKPEWPGALNWFKNSRDFPNIVVGLQRKGFTEREIEQIMGRNWFDFLSCALVPQVNSNANK